MLLSASLERISVSRMRTFFSHMKLESAEVSQRLTEPESEEFVKSKIQSYEIEPGEVSQRKTESASPPSPPWLTSPGHLAGPGVSCIGAAPAGGEVILDYTRLGLTGVTLYCN